MKLHEIASSFGATGKKWVRFAVGIQRAMEPGSSQSH